MPMDNSFFFYPKKNIKDVLCKNCIFDKECGLDSDFDEIHCKTYDLMNERKKQSSVFLKNIDKYYTDKISNRRIVAKKPIKKTKR